jgi:hypothetical protein
MRYLCFVLVLILISANAQAESKSIVIDGCERVETWVNHYRGTSDMLPAISKPFISVRCIGEERVPKVIDESISNLFIVDRPVSSCAARSCGDAPEEKTPSESQQKMKCGAFFYDDNTWGKRECRKQDADGKWR